MSIYKVSVALAVLGLAAPSLAVVVQWSGFEVGTNYGLGLVGENMVAPAGYGPPTSYGLVASPKTEGNSAQVYYVPDTVFGVAGGGWMIPDDGGGAFDPTDWTDFIVNTLGGPAPQANSPLKFIADVRIDADFLPGYTVLRWGPLHDAPSSTFAVWDVVSNGQTGVWATDFEFLSTAFDGAGQLSFILILESAFDLALQGVGNATFYLDNVRLQYIPEPATLSLLAVSSLALLRRRRR